MTTRGRKLHSPEQIIAKLRGAEAMLNAGKDLAVALQALGVSQSTYDRWRAQYGGMKAQEAKRLKELEDENRRFKQSLLNSLFTPQPDMTEALFVLMRVAVCVFLEESIKMRAATTGPGNLRQ
jgi:putative transposase